MKKTIDEKFSEVVSQMNDNQFWVYVRDWFDEQFILDTMNNWDEDTKKEAINEIKEIMRKVK